MLTDSFFYMKIYVEYGGRWKPLHYFAVNFFAPLIVIFTELPGKIQHFILNLTIIKLLLSYN